MDGPQLQKFNTENETLFLLCQKLKWQKNEKLQKYKKISTIFALRNRLHFVQSCDTFDSLSCRSQQHLEGEKMHQTGITMNNRQHYLTEPFISTLNAIKEVFLLPIKWNSPSITQESIDIFMKIHQFVWREDRGATGNVLPANYLR